MYYHKPPEPRTLTSPIPLNSDSVNDHEHTMSKHNSGPRFLNKKALHYNYLDINSQSQESTGWHVLIK